MDANSCSAFDSAVNSETICNLSCIGEVEEMLQEKKVDLATLPSQSFDKP